MPRTLFCPSAVLFDLDGTLVDTVPDLGGTVQDLQTARGMPVTPLEALRPYASHGARGLIGKGFGLTPEDESFEPLRVAFLNHYENRLAQASRLFEGMEDVLALLEARGIAWGVVTNKHERFTLPLLDALGLTQRCSAIVGGDTTAHAKPHPEPCLEAARRAGVPADSCWFLGDDIRDIQSGEAAGMYTVATAYGYCGSSLPPAQWNADVLVDSVPALYSLLDSALNL